ncbi:hypothetical protein DFH09DRAFT_1085852 [Mycena vulgaris]|nr:hypothetical protein DFH09DRAFT_1085852 [Mycena vulgaris]
MSQVLTPTQGLAVTTNFIAFETLSFLVGATSIITTITQPLAADLAPPERRASAISVVISGLIRGVLFARVLSGVLGQFASWRTVYYVGVGAQVVALLGCYLCLRTRLDRLDIRLFGLVGMLGVLAEPLMGSEPRRLIFPWYSTLFAIILLVVFNVIQLGAGGLSTAAVIVVAFALNLFRVGISMQKTDRLTGGSISDEARGRLNAVYVLSVWRYSMPGIGTSVESAVYLQHGWRACAALSVGLSGWQVAVLLVHGPHCRRYMWVGWEADFEPPVEVMGGGEDELDGHGREKAQGDHDGLNMPAEGDPN